MAEIITLGRPTPRIVVRPCGGWFQVEYLIDPCDRPHDRLLVGIFPSEDVAYQTAGLLARNWSAAFHPGATYD